MVDNQGGEALQANEAGRMASEHGKRIIFAKARREEGFLREQNEDVGERRPKRDWGRRSSDE